MGTERKRKVSLFDVVGDTSVSAKTRTMNGALTDGSSNGSSGRSSLMNRWNGRAYSARYYEILEKRKSLPVWQQKEEFFRVLKDSQTLILVGETGSGKTTQVGFSASVNCCHKPVSLSCYYASYYRGAWFMSSEITDDVRLAP